MMAVLNLGVLLRKSSVVMVISTLQLVPRIYQSTMHGQLPQDEVLTTLHLSGHYARPATTRRSPHQLTFIRTLCTASYHMRKCSLPYIYQGTMHGQLPHDEVLTILHLSGALCTASYHTTKFSPTYIYQEHYARPATKRRSAHQLTFIRSTMHGQLPHDEVLINLHLSGALCTASYHTTKCSPTYISPIMTAVPPHVLSHL